MGDFIFFSRPDYKFRLMIEVDTPDGLKSGSGVMSVRTGKSLGLLPSAEETRSEGQGVPVDLGDKTAALMVLGRWESDPEYM